GTGTRSSSQAGPRPRSRVDRELSGKRGQGPRRISDRRRPEGGLRGGKALFANPEILPPRADLHRTPRRRRQGNGGPGKGEARRDREEATGKERRLLRYRLRRKR